MMFKLKNTNYFKYIITNTSENTNYFKYIIINTSENTKI